MDHIKLGNTLFLDGRAEDLIKGLQALDWFADHQSDSPEFAN